MLHGPAKTKANKLAESNLDLTVEAAVDALKTADVIILATPGQAEDAKIVEFAKSLGDISQARLLSMPQIL